MNRILIRPARRWFSRRQQWTFELRAANGERIDPRDTVFNRGDLTLMLESFVMTGMLELVVYDRFDNVESRRRLR